MENDGQWQQALNIYTESLSYSPTHYKLRVSIGQTQRLLGNYKESIKIFEDLIKAVPIAGEWNFELAKSYFTDGNRTKALEHLEIVLNVWENADATYKPAIEAREKWTQWNQIN